MRAQNEPLELSSDCLWSCLRTVSGVVFGSVSGLSSDCPRCVSGLSSDCPRLSLDCPRTVSGLSSVLSLVGLQRLEQRESRCPRTVLGLSSVCPLRATAVVFGTSCPPPCNGAAVVPTLVISFLRSTTCTLLWLPAKRCEQEVRVIGTDGGSCLVVRKNRAVPVARLCDLCRVPDGNWRQMFGKDFVP